MDVVSRSLLTVLSFDDVGRKLVLKLLLGDVAVSVSIEHVEHDQSELSIGVHSHCTEHLNELTSRQAKFSLLLSELIVHVVDTSIVVNVLHDSLKGLIGEHFFLCVTVLEAVKNIANQELLVLVASVASNSEHSNLLTVRSIELVKEFSESVLGDHFIIINLLHEMILNFALSSGCDLSEEGLESFIIVGIVLFLSAAGGSSASTSGN